MLINNAELVEKLKTKDPDKINIAIFSDCYYPLIGGITSRVYNQAKELSAFANVAVITGEVGDYRDSADLPFAVIRCKGVKLSDYQGHLALPSLDGKFKKLLLSLHFDVIHLHTYFAMSKCAYMLKKKKNVPLIQVSHQRLYPEYLTIVHSRIIAKILTNFSIRRIVRADELWTVSQNVVDFYHASGIKREFKIDPSGTDKIYPENAASLIQAVNEKFDIPDNLPVLLSFGRVEANQKNLFFLLDALKLARDNGARFTFILAGNGKSLPELKKYAEKIGLDGVIYTGRVSSEELDGLLLRSDLHLFPSLNDNFGLTKVEAAVMKTPTLCISGTAVAEGLIDGENGFISENDKEKFADKLISVISDTEKLKKVSLSAEKTVGVTWRETVRVTYQNTLDFIKNFNERNNRE